MNEMYYSVRDPWKAPRLGASGKKIWVAFKSVVYGYLSYLLLAYASHMIAGTSPATTWQVFHFFPQIPSIDRGLIPVLLWDFGIIAAVLIIMIGATGVAKITYRQLKGDDFYGGSDAWKFALVHGRSTVSTPLIFAVLFGLICLSIWVLGWVSRIPDVGPVLLGISAIPAFLAALVGVYILIALLLSLLYTPAIIGTTGDDGLEGVIQVFSLLWSLPWRTAGYTAVAAFTSAVGTYLLAVISLGAFAMAGSIIAAIYGPTFANIAAGVGAYMPPECTFLSALPSWLWPGPFVALFPTQGFGLAFAENPSGVEAVAAFLGGISVLMVMGLVMAYGINCLSSGMTASYLVLRRIKDGEILLEWTDEVDELEEQVTDEEEQATAEQERVKADEEQATAEEGPAAAPEESEE
jgi:hypothetical protein